jgi:hypothetical protein
MGLPNDLLENFVGDVRRRLAELNALLAAIDAGELLAEAPSDIVAKRRHADGIALLGIVERQVQDWVAAVDEQLEAIDAT